MSDMKKILVVDDEETCARLCVLILRRRATAWMWLIAPRKSWPLM